SSKGRTSSVSAPKSPKLIKKMVALFDYNPNEYSPNANSNDELSFHSGDIIYIHGNIHDDGFYSGELENGKKGFVPSNYLEEISDENTIEKPTESHEKKETPTNVNYNETTTTEKIVEQPPPTPPTEAPKLGFFDRFKSTFSWNLNEPI
ncbi:unnamed protein product, partial [Rotaria sp. Silwood2]